VFVGGNIRFWVTNLNIRLGQTDSQVRRLGRARAAYKKRQEVLLGLHDNPMSLMAVGGRILADLAAFDALE